MTAHAKPKGEGRPLNVDAAGGLTQYEIAALLGISRARVAQIEKRAMRKLRRALREWAP